jgi:hypothetical protein
MKGIICKIEEPENMPVDERGVRADVIADGGSTISRMNLGRLHETYMSAAAVECADKIREILNTEKTTKSTATIHIGDMYNKDPDRVLTAYNYYLGLLKIMTEEQYSYYSQITDISSINEILAHIVSDTVYVYYPIGNKKEHLEIIKEIEESPYKPHYGPVKYKDKYGNEIQTEGPVRIAPLYMILLEKIADTWLSVSSAKPNHFGVITSLNKVDKYRTPWRQSPVKTIGETEGRLFTAYCGKEAIAEMMDRSNNQETHKAIYEKILKAEKPMQIDEVVDRSKIPYGNCRPMQLVDHVSECAGFKIVYEPED